MVSLAPAIGEQDGQEWSLTDAEANIHQQSLQTTCPKGIADRTVPISLMGKCKSIPLVIAKAGQLPGALLPPPRDTTINILFFFFF